MAHHCTYHMSPLMYDSLAANGKSEKPLFGAHKKRSKYDEAILEYINKSFGLARHCDEIVIV